MITVKLIDREAVVNLVEGLEDFEKDRAIKAGLRSAVSVFKTAGKRNLRQRLKTPGGVTDNLMKSFTNKVKRTKLGALSGFARPAGSHSTQYTAMGLFSQQCRVFINVVSDNYDRSQDIAELILGVLEGDQSNGLRIRLKDSTEDYEDKKFIQVLLFEISNS